LEKIMGLRGRKLVKIKDQYWLRVKHLQGDILTYDSFIKQGGVVKELDRDITGSLSAILKDIQAGYIQVE
jgi:hypothetical protein